MARSRNIKPGLYKNEKLAECTIWARFIFPGLWLLADRLGRLEDRPRRIGGELLPYDNENVDILLDELARAGVISRYEVDGCRYIQVLSFTKHQSPHVREQDSTIPPECGRSIRSTTKDGAGPLPGSAVPSPRSPDSLNPSLLKPDYPIPISAAPSRPVPVNSHDNHEIEKFDLAWQAYPKRPGASRADTLKNWIARVKSGTKIDEMMAGVIRYAAYVAENAVEPKYIKQPSTFFGPGEHFLADWSPAPVQKRGGTAQLGKAGQATARNAQQWLEEQSHATI